MRPGDDPRPDEWGADPSYGPRAPMVPELGRRARYCDLPEWWRPIGRGPCDDCQGDTGPVFTVALCQVPGEERYVCCRCAALRALEIPRPGQTLPAFDRPRPIAPCPTRHGRQRCLLLMGHPEPCEVC